ncbi:MAG: hypothetical protein OXF49_03550 [Candidatus Saccharibacteria bacterium]|nr:hypothetical protein [Candidatus Saccharibacteria bacterium]
MTKKKEPLKLVSQGDGKPFIDIEIDLESNVAVLKAPQTDDTTLYGVERI